MIPYGKQWIDEEDIQAVTATLKNDFLTQGPQVAAFEKRLCELTGAGYAVAVSNGTAALHLALLALDIKDPNTEVITSPNSFLSSANVSEMCGFQTRFADIDPETANICPKALQKKLSQNTKVIIPVHFSGNPCDLEAISQLARANGSYVIEDACHAVGSRYRESVIGDCAYSDMTVFSFHPVKQIAMGEGGAITTNNKAIYDRLMSLRTHGMVRDSDQLKKPSEGPWYYEMQQLGYNYRVTDLQCALGLSQLKKLTKFKARRSEIIGQYRASFTHPDCHLISALEEADPSFHLAVLKINFEKIGVTRAEVMLALKEKGIGTQVHYIPIYQQPYYEEKYGVQAGQFPNTEAYYAQCLSIPLYPKMSDEDVEKVIHDVLETLGLAT